MNTFSHSRFHRLYIYIFYLILYHDFVSPLPHMYVYIYMLIMMMYNILYHQFISTNDGKEQLNKKMERKNIYVFDAKGAQ